MALQDLLRSGQVDGETRVPDDPSELTAAGAEGGAGDELPPDPAPSRRGKTRRSKVRQTTAAKRATKAEQDQVRDALTMLYTLPAWGLSMRDAHCGGALMDQRDAIVGALAPIVCRNPAMLAFFTAANAPWMDYLALFQALMPVAQTIWGHHVTHTVGGTDAGPGGVPVDLSAYSAPAYSVG